MATKNRAQAVADLLGGEQVIRLSESDSVMFAGFPDLLKTSHMEIILGVSSKTVRKLCADGEIPSVTIGGQIYVPKPKFIEYVVNGAVNG